MSKSKTVLPDYVTQINQLEVKVETLTKDIGIKNDKISQLTTENENLSHTCALQEEEQKNKAQEYALNAQKLNETISTITRDNKSLEDLLDDLRNEVTQAGENLNQKEEENKVLNSRVGELEIYCRSLKEGYQQIESELDEIMIEKLLLEKRLARYKFLEKIKSIFFKRRKKL